MSRLFANVGGVRVNIDEVVTYELIFKEGYYYMLFYFKNKDIRNIRLDGELSSMHQALTDIDNKIKYSK